MINIEFIPASVEYIQEHDRATIELNRVQDSQLNVSQLLSKAFDNVFRWNVTPEDDFDASEEQPYDTLLVFHHRFEAAPRTLELRSFWDCAPKG